MNKCVLLLITLLISFGQALSQDKIVLVRNSRGQGFTAKDLDGQKLFELPVEHLPGVRSKFEPFYLDNFVLYDFTEGIMGVEHPKGYYILNQKGEKIHSSYNKVKFISKPSEGYIRVFEVNHKDNSQSYVKFFGKDNIKHPLNKTAYWEATNFEGGQAIVQLDNKDGDWLAIDSTGKTIQNFTEQFNCEISPYNIPYENSVWKLNTKNNCAGKGHVIYFNDAGKCSMNYKDVKPTTWDYAKKIDDFNLNFLEKINTLKVGGKKFKISENNNQQFIINQLNIISPNDPITINCELLALEHMSFMESYLNKYIVICIITRGDYEETIVIDTETSKVVSRFDEFPISGSDGIFLFGTNKHSVKKVKSAANVNGVFLYGKDPSTKIYKNLKLASKKPLQVENLELNDLTIAQLNDLVQFKNLKSLKLIESDITFMPVLILSKMVKLEVLSLSKFSNLKSLPLELGELPKLNRVVITDCDNVDNTFAFLSSAFALSSIRTDLYLSKDQRSSLKAMFPNLKIEEIPVEDSPR
jgi:hypothetical protein